MAWTPPHALQVGGTPKPAKSVTKNVKRVLRCFAGSDSPLEKFSAKLQDQNFTLKKNLAPGLVYKNINDFLENPNFHRKLLQLPLHPMI